MTGWAAPDSAGPPILPLSATYIFAVTIPDKPSALPISYRQIVDDIGETGKGYEIKCQKGKEDHDDLIVRPPESRAGYRTGGLTGIIIPLLAAVCANILPAAMIILLHTKLEDMIRAQGVQQIPTRD
jgi:hypothetical protein